MTKCSNCEQVFVGIPSPKTLWLFSGSTMIAAICTKCQESVLVEKIVIRRDSTKERFVFEACLPAECEKVAGATQSSPT